MIGTILRWLDRARLVAVLNGEASNGSHVYQYSVLFYEGICSRHIQFVGTIFPYSKGEFGGWRQAVVWKAGGPRPENWSSVSFARTETEEGKPMSDVPEMIERVARAISAAEHNDDGLWDTYVGAAETVLDAIREPSDAMLAASEREWDGRMSARSAGVWQAMVDAAIGKPPAAR